VRSVRCWTSYFGGVLLAPEWEARLRLRERGEGGLLRELPRQALQSLPWHTLALKKCDWLVIRGYSPLPIDDLLGRQFWTQLRLS
jgi:hypothetical protein